MDSEWESLRLAAKAADRDKAFREHWPSVEAQLRQWGYPSWGIAQVHFVLSSGGTVNAAVEALGSEEEATPAGRARASSLQRLARRRGFAVRRRPSAPSPRPIAPGRWMIVDPRSGRIVGGSGATGQPGMTLDDVEAWLTRDAEHDPA
jgi:hypothetical protein